MNIIESNSESFFLEEKHDYSYWKMSTFLYKNQIFSLTFHAGGDFFLFMTFSMPFKFRSTYQGSGMSFSFFSRESLYTKNVGRKF